MSTATKATTGTPVEPNTPRWRELVDLGVLKDADRNWTLGQIAAEVAPVGEDGVNTGALANLALISEEIGVEYHSMREYRRTFAEWGDTRLSPSVAGWKVHSMFTGANKAKLVEAASKLAAGERITVTRAHELLNYNNAGRTKVPTPQQQAKNVAKAVADPAIAELILGDPTLLNAVPIDVIKAFLKAPAGERVLADLTTPLTEELERRSFEADELRRKLAEAEARTADPDTELARVQAALAAREDALATATAKADRLAASEVSSREDIQRAKRKQEALQSEVNDMDRRLAAIRKERDELRRQQRANADPDRELRQKAGDQYHAILADFYKAGDFIKGIDRRLTADGVLVTGDDARAALIQTGDALSMELSGVLYKLGKDISTASLG